MKLKKLQVEPKEVAPKEAKEKDVEVTEEFNTPVDNNGSDTFTVKLDSKKISNRTHEQTLALVQGVLGSVTKITIERD